jgi:mRNA interferase RelE/StbE
MAGQTYELRFSPRGEKDFKKFEKSQHKAVIKKACDEICKDPKNCPKSTPLINHDCQYRYRIGDLRVLYNVYEEAIEVWVIAIESRGQVYKKKR